MRIALLSFEYPPETGFGGIGTYSWYQARALAKLGHEVHVLAGATEPTALRESEHDGVRVFRFRASDLERNCRIRTLAKRELWWSKNRLENAISMEKGLLQLMERFDYDVVEMPECGAEGMRINGRIGPPTLIKFHSPAKLIMGSYDVPQRDRELCPRFEQKAIDRATGFTSCSRFLADEVRDKLGVKKHVEVIYNGIDLDLFDAGEQVDARERFDIPKDKLMIFFAGRLEPRKGIHVMKDVVAKVLQRHDVCFAFAGHDLFQYAEKEMVPYFESLDLKGSYKFLGKLDLREVRSCLHQADLFVIPSLWENCPYSCLEAMAAGRAIVSSDAGGLPELIEDRVHGLVAKTESVDETVACLVELIEDEGLRESCGAAARSKVEAGLTDVAIAAQTQRYYEKLRESS